MGGRPIRGNEWLSTTGHSACTACHVEMRISFERQNLTMKFNSSSYSFYFLLIFLTTYKLVTTDLSYEKQIFLCVWSDHSRVTIIIKHHQRSCHTWTLAFYFLLFTGRELVFLFGIAISFPEFHHLFLEQPILLNWHLNICWPVHYSSHITYAWYPREDF